MVIFLPCQGNVHDDVIKWKHFLRHWPFVRGIHRSPVNSPHKGQWRGALMFSLIYAWINDWANTRNAGDLRRHRAHYDVTVISTPVVCVWLWLSFKFDVIWGLVDVWRCLIFPFLKSAPLTLDLHFYRIFVADSTQKFTRPKIGHTYIRNFNPDV